MDWNALALSLRLGFWACVVLMPLAVVVSRILAWGRFRGKGLVVVLIALPLVLPPTVLGYYLLTAFGGASPLGQAYEALTGHGLVFTFDGLVVASVFFNLPFAVQPMHRSFEAIPEDVREAAWCSGMSYWRTFWRIELPLAWPGVISALALTLAHTLGEFGVVLMIGGNIPDETRTISLAIYDRVQGFDDAAAAAMSALLLLVSFLTISVVYWTGYRSTRTYV